MPEPTTDQFSYDAFISHASEDKDRFVRPLALALEGRGLHVWFDEFELKIGDSIPGKISEGLSQSQYGVVVLSPAFFAKSWPRMELDTFLAEEGYSGEQRILPVWLDIDAAEVKKNAPLLFRIFAAHGFEENVQQVAGMIADRIEGTLQRPRQSIRPGRARASRIVGELHQARVDLETLEPGDFPEGFDAWVTAAAPAIKEARDFVFGSRISVDKGLR